MSASSIPETYDITNRLEDLYKLFLSQASDGDEKMDEEARTSPMSYGTLPTDIKDSVNIKALLSVETDRKRPCSLQVSLLVMGEGKEF